MSDQKTLSPPLKPFVKRDDQGKPYLAGTKCTSCNHIYVGERTICANCYARDKMTPHRLAETGTLYVYTIIHRSFPGIKTPFIDVIVDLDDGAHIKGCLEGVAPDPEQIEFGLPVKVAFYERAPVNMPDTPHLTYVFEPLAPNDKDQSK